MKLVIDTNIILSGLIKDSITRKILLSSEFEFFILDFYLTELNKYKSAILEKIENDEENLNKLIGLLQERIIIVPEKEYSKKIKKANQIIGEIDSKDIPFVALALSLKVDGIWSYDKHFQRQKEIRIYSTSELIEHLKEVMEK